MSAVSQDQNLIVISKQDFKEYVNCQNLGYFNMLDYDSWKNYTFLTKEKWYHIIRNYTHYHKMYSEQ